MPDEVIRKTIPELTAGAIIQGSLFENAQPNVQASTGYNSVKVTADDVSNYVATTKTYSQLQTTSKTLVSAINEAAQSGGGGASVIQKTLAEYQALPQSSKMNGSIYKITDKALIYCLDEEYHAYKELTSIQYQALTSDEKNNGTIYIITDEETTADDIPYTTGVSVGDKLDDLANLTKIIFSGNISKTITAGGVVALTGSELGALPAGYTAVGLLSQYSTHSNVTLISYDIAAFGSASQFGILKNWGTTNANVTVNYRTLVMKSAYVS